MTPSPLRSLQAAALALLLGSAVALTFAVALVGWPDGTGWPAIPAAGAAEGAKPNACGCYRDLAGSCYCGKKTRCGCPGDCEPRGCDEKRNKQMEKEIQAETRKAQEQSRRHAEEKPSGRAAAERDEDLDSVRKERPKAKRPVVRMTATQRKEFLRLLDIYIAEDPDHRGRTVEQARSAARSGSP